MKSHSFPFKNIFISSFFICTFIVPFSHSSYLQNLQLNHLNSTTDVTSNYSIESISTGDNYSGAVINNNITGTDELYTWGWNKEGQLGLGDDFTENFYNTPQHVTLLPEGDIEQISMGGHHSAAVVDDGSGDIIYTWGSDSYGQLGNGGSTAKDNYPLPIIEYNMPKGDIKSISLGEHHSAAVITDDQGSDFLYTWGRDEEGQLGSDNHDAPINTPELASNLSSYNNLEQISMRNHTSSAIINDGTNNFLYMWGLNAFGQLGNKNNDDYSDKPKKVCLPENESVEQVSLGENHSTAVLVDKKGNESLYTWGRNTSGQLGLGTIDSEPHNTPQKVKKPPQGNIEQVSAGFNYSGIVMSDEEGDYLWTWGDNSKGQLGTGTMYNQSYPKPIQISENNIDIKQISMGKSHTMALVNDGVNDYLYSWGSNSEGQLGLGIDDNYKNTPQLVLLNPNNIFWYCQTWFFILCGIIVLLLSLLIGWIICKAKKYKEINILKRRINKINRTTIRINNNQNRKQNYIL